MAIFWDLQPLWPSSLTKPDLLRFRCFSWHVLSKTKSVTPHSFHISDITNSSSFSGKIFRKKPMSEIFAWTSLSRRCQRRRAKQSGGKESGEETPRKWLSCLMATPALVLMIQCAQACSQAKRELHVKVFLFPLSVGTCSLLSKWLDNLLLPVYTWVERGVMRVKKPKKERKRMCSYRKYPYCPPPLHRRDWNFLGDGGVGSFVSQNTYRNWQSWIGISRGLGAGVLR